MKQDMFVIELFERGKVETFVSHSEKATGLLLHDLLVVKKIPPSRIDVYRGSRVSSMDAILDIVAVGRADEQDK